MAGRAGRDDPRQIPGRDPDWVTAFPGRDGRPKISSGPGGPVPLGSSFMSTDRARAAALTARARELWESLAGAGAEFTPAVSAAVSPGARICPPGWAGVVVIAGAVLATAPDAGAARLLDHALGDVPLASLSDAAVLASRLPLAGMLGPTALAYLDPAEFHPQPGAVCVTETSLDDPALRPLLQAASSAEVEESGLEEISPPAFVVREHRQVVAAAGYRDWPRDTAQLSVLTSPAARDRGFARAVASAAVAHAIKRGRLPQWRARVLPSQRVARALGFRELGSQVSLRLLR